MQNRALVCVVLAAVVGCRAPARVHKPGDEWLVAIKIEGSHAFDPDDLVPRLQLNRTLLGGRAVDAYQLSVDTERIRAAYLRKGFFDVTVVPRIDIKQSKGTTQQTVVFKIIEGRRSATQVEIRGLPPEVAPADARALIGLRDGGPFDYEAYDAAKQPMIALVQDAGYPGVNIDAAVLADKAQGIATVRFEIAPGTRAAFGRISIGGAEGQLADAILGRLAFHEGDPYSATAIAQSQRALYDLGRFSTVRIDSEKVAGATVVPVKISVTLGTLHELRGGFGAGWDPVTLEFRLRGGVSVIPKNAPLWTLATDLRPAIGLTHGFQDPLPKIRALATATRIDLFRPRVQGELELSADYLTLEAYKTYGPRFRAGIRSPLGRPWLVGRVGWLFEYLLFADILLVDPADIAALNLDQSQRRGAFELAIDADLRDDSVSPHFGLFASLRATQGSRFAGSAMTYSQVTPELRGYVPLGSAIVLAGRARLGLLFGDVPVTERYYSGGASNHRGFADRNLSPTAGALVNGEPTQRVIGGTALIEAGVELRIPLGETPVPYGTQIFSDWGDVVAQREDLDPTHLHWAVGAGLYIQAAGLKARLDVGYRLNRHGPGELEPTDGVWQNLTWHLAVGETY